MAFCFLVIRSSIVTVPYLANQHAYTCTTVRESAGERPAAIGESLIQSPHQLRGNKQEVATLVGISHFLLFNEGIMIVLPQAAKGLGQFGLTLL